MLQIALCEDNPQELQETATLLKKHLPLFFPEFTLKTYSCGTSLLEEIEEQQTPFDLLFLDIYLTDGSGIDIAHHIRNRKLPTQIVLITSSQEYIMESYHINAAYYIVKPIKEKWLLLALEKVAGQLSQIREVLTVHSEHNTLEIPQDSILYAEVFGNKTTIYTVTKAISVYLPLKQIQSMLSPEKFLLIQRAF